MNNGQTVAITGSSAGLGALLAELLAQKGYNLILINRNAQKAAQGVEKLLRLNPKIRIDSIAADLASEPAIEKAAQEILSRHTTLDVLFNNAGILLGEKVMSAHANEMHFQVNTLAPYLLTKLLRQPLAAVRGMVINVSSGAIFMTGTLRVDELRNPASFRKLVGPYGQSKLALNAMSNGLAPELKRDGIIIRTNSPGPNRTAMTAGSGMPLKYRIFRPFLFVSPMSGAQKIYDSAFDPRFGRQSGVFISSNRITPEPDDAVNPVIQKQVLELCRFCTGI
ncbi:MAG: SDR family NAD(P)-dependent oxidoreductase [Blastocatellia bacterium]|nr:SDR family NAD(P)-dependent oxidoreductase [Blastocatellia bacterium]